MPRSCYPPHDFTCPYEHNCPHLDWMSTRWVLGEYRRAEETYQEHLRTTETIDAEKKKRGAPGGHPGWFREKPTHVDRTVEVSAPIICPYCKSRNLTPVEGVSEHLQEDIVLQPRPFVTRYLHHEAFCSHCNRPVVQAAEGELLNAPIGPVAKSAAIYLRYRIGMTYSKVQGGVRDLFGLKFVPASAVGFDRQAN